MQSPSPEPVPPRLSLAALFTRFLSFGARAWGGPVAQIALLKQELVEQERWVSRERFHRALAVYQVLPGPEAHELCVWFGMLARGRLGALVAGLGFLLPGLTLMLAVSWLYVRGALGGPTLVPFLAGMHVAVAALIVRAVPRLGAHALGTVGLGALAGLAFGMEASGRLPFVAPLLCAALVHPLVRRRAWAALVPIAGLLGVATFLWATHGGSSAHAAAATGALVPATPLDLAVTGLKAGLLTFGGAYTAISLVQRDAVRWMSLPSFNDGLGLALILPAPLIIFTTFVGYVAGGPTGALLMTAGTFLPAFAFTLLGHEFFEKLVERSALHDALDGVMAAVVGIVAWTAVSHVRRHVTTALDVLLFALALATLWRWRSRWATAAVVLACGALHLLLRPG